MQEFESVAHAKTHLRYHVILATKYRRKALSGIETDTYDTFRSVEADSAFRIIDMGIDNGDHIHLVLKFRPALSVEQVVRRIKHLTTTRLWTTHEHHLRQHYWGTKKKLWSGGYFASTIGPVSEQTVLAYVQKQAS